MSAKYKTSYIRQAMEAHQVVPDVIDQAPSEGISVVYPGHKEANFGNELTPRQVIEQPEVSWDAEHDTYYTLLMVDPDAPSRADPKFREFNHWQVVNIPETDISKGEVLTGYRGSGPPKGTGLHRYVFLVYKQDSILRFNEPRIGPSARDNRASFSARKFADKYKLGKPIAANFFQAQWDTSVDQRNKNKRN